jgi:hypothetical protein
MLSKAYEEEAMKKSNEQLLRKLLKIWFELHLKQGSTNTEIKFVKCGSPICTFTEVHCVVLDMKHAVEQTAMIFP